MDLEGLTYAGGSGEPESFSKPKEKASGAMTVSKRESAAVIKNTKQEAKLQQLQAYQRIISSIDKQN